MNLTPRENFQRMMTRRDPQWIPMELPMTPPIVDRMEKHLHTRDEVTAFDLDFRHLGCWPAGDVKRWRAALEALGAELPTNAELGAFGDAHVPPPAQTVGDAYHFRTMLHPLSHVTDVEQLKTLPWPVFDPAQITEQFRNGVNWAHSQGRVAHAGMECTVFEQSWYARGMDNLYCDLIDDNGIGGWLLDWHTHRSVVTAGAAAAAGVDVIGLGDDIGTQRGMMMSADFWRQHLKPRLARVIQSIRENQTQKVWVKYHSDGDIREVVDDLIEIGVDILNPVQPECMTLGEVIPRWQDKLGFWGMIGTQTTMPFGSTDDVRAAVQSAADFAKSGLAVIIAPTHVLEPDVPWENVIALVEAVKGALK